MPPKKQDPQQIKRQFEEWQKSIEYSKLQEVNKQLHSLPRISETSTDSDLSGKFQVLWDQILEFGNLLKVKAPFKRIEHQWIRSIYFGEKKKEKPPFLYYDGILCEHQNVEADSQHNLRQVFIKRMYNIFEDVNFKVMQIKSIDQSNYIKTKAELKKAYADFYKQMKNHTKKSFKIIYQQKLIIVLQPLINLMEINMKLVMFDLKYQTRQDKIINGFKYRAFVDKYSVCLQEAMRILSEYQSKPIKQTPNVRMIFKKLQYQNLTKIESFYIQPLRQALQKMKKGLASLFSTGINFWKVPLEYNTKFVEDLKILIKWELITQRLFGNDLLRDQINFVSNAIQIIQKANPLAQKYMKAEDPNAIEISIPRLIVFKTIQHMRHILDLKFEQKKLIQEKVLKVESPVILEIKQDKLAKSSITLNKTGNNFSKVLSEEKNVLNQQKRLEEQERKKYGRFWLWTHFCDEEHRKIFDSCVQSLRHINKAVHQDIEDAIIRQGMLPRKDRQNEQLKEAAQNLKNMKTTDNSHKIQNMKRPPQLWNFPKVIEQEHRFRSIADPKKSYIDGRIEQLDKHIVVLGEHLRKKNQVEWNELIRRVIDFYRNKHDPEPHFV